MPPSAGIITSVAPIVPIVPLQMGDEGSVALPVILALGGALFLGVAAFAIAACVCFRPDFAAEERDSKRDRDLAITLTASHLTSVAFASGRDAAGFDSLRSRQQLA